MSDQSSPAATQEQTPPKSQISGTEAVELRIIIKEKNSGTIDVKYAATLEGSEVLIPIRPAHLLGLLQSAIILIGTEIYGKKK